MASLVLRINRTYCYREIHKYGYWFYISHKTTRIIQENENKYVLKSFTDPNCFVITLRGKNASLVYSRWWFNWLAMTMKLSSLMAGFSSIFTCFCRCCVESRAKFRASRSVLAIFFFYLGCSMSYNRRYKKPSEINSLASGSIVYISHSCVNYEFMYLILDRF